MSGRDPMARAFLHLTVETGHVRLSPRGEVADGALRALRPMVAEAIRSGEPVELRPSAWWLSAAERGPMLDASLWWGEAAGDPHVRFTATRRTLTALAPGLVRLPLTQATKAAAEAVHVERCVAWAWLESRPAA